MKIEVRRFHRKWTRRKEGNEEKMESPPDRAKTIETRGAYGQDTGSKLDPGSRLEPCRTPVAGDEESSAVRVGNVSGMLVRGQVEGVPIEWKIDTGAKSTFITKETYDMMLNKPALAEMDSSYVTASGQKLRCYGQAQMNIAFGENVYPHEVVVGGVRSNLIGEDFITMYRCNWDHDESSFIIKGSRMPLEGGRRATRAARVIALETVLVPPGHEAVIKC